MDFVKKIAAVAIISTMFSTAIFAADQNAMVKEGRKVFVTKKLGNCLACHTVQGDPSIPQAGDIGPKLANLDTYPKQYLFDKIWDPNKTVPNSVMPPMGRSHKITKEQVNALVAYLQAVTKTK
ncbi:MAG: sulfur oxidation c-type cytochrome SoxX [Sulfurospirillaceae bacterium]|nr:sulfur oxidation c-type cytochrome SoxX [Sulfurospirillaceae bacterium]